MKNLENIFFKEMAVASSILTLGGWVQLFWTAFDMAVTGVPLEVALGYKKLFFGCFKKIIMDIHLPDNFLKCPKNYFLYPNATFNGTPVTAISKAAQNN